MRSCCGASGSGTRASAQAPPTSATAYWSSTAASPTCDPAARLLLRPLHTAYAAVAAHFQLKSLALRNTQSLPPSGVLCLLQQNKKLPSGLSCAL